MNSPTTSELSMADSNWKLKWIKFAIIIINSNFKFMNIYTLYVHILYLISLLLN